MRFKGILEKIIVKFNTADEIELTKEDIKNFNCTSLVDNLDMHSDFDEYEADYTYLEIYKKSNKFINQGNLKGNLFLVFKRNIIHYFEVYTTETKYKIYPVQEVVDTKYAFDQNNQPLSKQSGFGDEYNIAQATIEYESGDFAVIISTEIADMSYEGAEYYD